MMVHLEEIDPKVTKGSEISRQSKIGKAGSIYDFSKAARTDSVYGEAHFRIPADPVLPLLAYGNPSSASHQPTPPVHQIRSPRIADRNDAFAMTKRIRGDTAASASDLPSDAHHGERVALTARVLHFLSDAVDDGGS